MGPDQFQTDKRRKQKRSLPRWTMEDVSKKLIELELGAPTNDVPDVPTTVTVVVIEGDSNNPPPVSINLPVTRYLVPLYEEYMKKVKPNVTEENSNGNDDAFRIPAKLMENLYHFIWGPDVFKAGRPQLKRIYDEMSAKLAVFPGQSDLEDMLQYHPTEVVFTKFIQLIVGMALVEPIQVMEDFKYLEELLKDERVCVEDNAHRAYEFLLQSLKQFFMILTGNQSEITNEFLEDFSDLNRESKAVIKGLSVLYMKVLRAKPKERLERLEKVISRLPGSVEWILYNIELLRVKRRESISKSKRPTPRELELVEETLKMERDNPFVRWSLIDCVIDAVRETNGRFHCGDQIRLYDTNQAMQFLQNECSKLCEDFPRNVSFLSSVSDYFARYVPFVYFDKTLSGELLLNAYEINPNNAKTTHRLGIFYRMNMKDGKKSLEWLEKTLELDPSHFNANMDYYKSILGKPAAYRDTGKKMEERLKSLEASCWRWTEKTDFQFYVGLAYFAEGKKEDTLLHWMEVMKANESQFQLSGVDSDCAFFSWDSKFISTDKIREWIHEEWKHMKKDLAGDLEPERKKHIERMFYLMLGIVDPKRPEPYSGAYTDRFEHALKF